MNFSTRHLYLFRWAELSRIEIETQIGIQALKMLIQNQEDSLVSTRLKFQQLIADDEELKSLPPEEKGGYYSSIFEMEERMIDELQRQQRYFSCQSIFAFFEGRLEEVCALIEKSFTFKIKLSDLKKQETLIFYWNFLENIFEINTEEVEPFFTPIKQNKVIRNKIAHQNGLIASSDKERLPNTPGINFEEAGDKLRIILTDSSYTIYILGRMVILLSKLFVIIDKRYQELQCPSKI